jgi:hypothetical protein
MIIFSDHFHFITSCSRFGSLLGADTPSSHTPSTDGAAATLPRSSIVVMLPNRDRPRAVSERARCGSSSEPSSANKARPARLNIPRARISHLTHSVIFGGIVIILLIVLILLFGFGGYRLGPGMGYYGGGGISLILLIILVLLLLRVI